MFFQLRRAILSAMDIPGLKKYVEELFRTRLPESFTYHNWDHTLAVWRAVVEFAAYSGITDAGAVELEAAALFHDTGYFYGEHRGHEKRSAGLAGKLLPGFGMAPEAVARVRRLIEATVFPCRPRTLEEEIIFDADIEYLGRGGYDEVSAKLREELASQGRSFDDGEWRRFQDGFLSRVRFFSPAGRALRQPGLERLREARGIKFIPGGFNA